MTQMHIGSLALKLSAADPVVARRLAERVALGLRRLSLTDPLPKDRDIVQAGVDAASAPTWDRLADQIAAELIRQLERH